ncbi:MAG: hypothetical protein LKF79_07840 [Solobacterium sp.]|nr:hypothetical protein [Solobacterium sp.]MCH4223139.1 hypothetical protein [Solobacterium sp.]MCH4266538.1 hypothetical protein [Solobacterium sp.]
MKRYKVKTCTVSEAETIMNSYVFDGWRILSVVADNGTAHGIIIVLEKDA